MMSVDWFAHLQIRARKLAAGQSGGQSDEVVLRLSESVNPLPSFRQAFPIRESACLGECVAVRFYGKWLVLTDETSGDLIAREVDVFSVGASVESVTSTACIKRLPCLRIVSNKKEVSS